MENRAQLYDRAILDHNKRPRNFRVMANPTHSAERDNPLCGDRIAIYLRLKDHRIEEASFQGSGCAIAKASASIMTDAIMGHTQAEARSLCVRIETLMNGANESTTDLGECEALLRIRDYPVRISCAMLPWRALLDALEGTERTEGTEGTEEG